MKLRPLSLLIASLWGTFAAIAQQNATTSKETPDQQGTPAIVEHIRQADHHEIEAADEIINLLFPTDKSDTRQEGRSSRRIVYVIQVYSSSAGSRAKSEAQRIMAQVKSKFPNYDCRLKWTNPNWRVFVGAFATREEAESALSKIRRACPSVAREAHIARDTR